MGSVGIWERKKWGIYAAVVRKQAFKVLLEAEQLSETVIPAKNGMCILRGEIKPLSQVHTQTPFSPVRACPCQESSN